MVRNSSPHPDLPFHIFSLTLKCPTDRLIQTILIPLLSLPFMSFPKKIGCKYDIAPASKMKYSNYVKQGKLSESLLIGSQERSRFKRGTESSPAHGGEASVGKRKDTRPFSPKVATHLVLKSKRARGIWSLRHRKNHAKVTAMIYVYAARFKVRVYRAANAGNTLQLLVKANDRKALADFLRVLAGRIAVTVSGAKKGIKRIGKFWNHLYWSRLVRWGREFHSVQRLVMNSVFHEETGSTPGNAQNQKERVPISPVGTLYFSSD
jgi:hypothetical protein